MKTNKILLSCFAAAVFFTACSNDENETIPQKTITLTCNMADASRTSIAGSDFNGSYVPFKWTDGDVVIVTDGTNVVQAPVQIDPSNSSAGKVEVSGLNDADGTVYKIFYGSKYESTRFNLTKGMSSYPEVKQVQSSANNSDHIHKYGGTNGTAGYGDCGYATVTLPQTSFVLQHKNCYFLFRLKKSASCEGKDVLIDSIKVENVANVNNKKYLMSGGIYVVGMDGTTSLVGGGRQYHVNLKFSTPIELSSDTDSYAFAVFVPSNNSADYRITYSYSVDGIDKIKEVDKKDKTFSTGGMYRVSQYDIE